MVRKSNLFYFSIANWCIKGIYQNSDRIFWLKGSAWRVWLKPCPAYIYFKSECLYTVFQIVHLIPRDEQDHPDHGQHRGVSFGLRCRHAGHRRHRQVPHWGSHVGGLSSDRQAVSSLQGRGEQAPHRVPHHADLPSFPLRISRLALCFRSRCRLGQGEWRTGKNEFRRFLSTLNQKLAKWLVIRNFGNSKCSSLNSTWHDLAKICRV